jgi:hypothetical protein
MSRYSISGEEVSPSTMNRALQTRFNFAFTGRSSAYYCGGSGSAELVRGEVSE